MLRTILFTGATILAASGVKRLARFVATQLANRDHNNNIHLLNDSIRLPRRFIAWLPRFLSVETSPGLRDKGTFLFLGGEARNESQRQFQKKPSQISLHDGKVRVPLTILIWSEESISRHYQDNARFFLQHSFTLNQGPTIRRLPRLDCWFAPP
ncbi:hypothetical protein BSKO_09232 [Bryopsis sp. KO-2023]|nr:hypothetical protein BSKO_09232 [Bryopsis sp. KO-2023]